MLSFLAALGASAVLAAACGGGGGDTGTAPSPGTGSTASAAPDQPATTNPSALGPSSPGPTWGSGPTTVVHHPAVLPVPVITGVRYAAHAAEGYDRIVFDIGGALPGYSVRYVSRVVSDPAEQPVNVPGRRHLLIVLNPAQAHRDDGAATVTGIHRINLPMLESYAVVGDYEGYVSIALGLDDVVGYRVGELPGRIYVDVAA